MPCQSGRRKSCRAGRAISAPSGGRSRSSWNDLGAVEAALARHGDQIALVLMEPILCNYGCCPPRMAGGGRIFVSPNHTGHDIEQALAADDRAVERLEQG